MVSFQKFSLLFVLPVIIWTLDKQVGEIQHWLSTARCCYLAPQPWVFRFLLIPSGNWQSCSESARLSRLNLWPKLASSIQVSFSWIHCFTVLFLAQSCFYWNWKSFLCLAMYLCTQISFNLSMMILITRFMLRLLVDLSAGCWGAKNII